MGLLRDQIGKWNYGQAKEEGTAHSTPADAGDASALNPYAGADALPANRKMQASFYEAKVKLHQNNVQKKLDGTIEKLRAEEKPIRIIILKSRQMGISTDIEGRMIYETTQKKNRNGLVVAHRDDSTAAIFAKTKYYYDNLESDIKPLQQASNAKELIFDRPTH